MVVEQIVQEAVNELTGRSKQRWGVIVVAFVLGAATVVTLILRAQKHGLMKSLGGSHTVNAATTPDWQPPPSEDGKSGRPGWAYRRAQIARSEASMRARVTRAASQLNPRKRAAEGDTEPESETEVISA